MIFWEYNGIWLLYKRQGESRFKVPNIIDNFIELS